MTQISINPAPSTRREVDIARAAYVDAYVQMATKNSSGCSRYAPAQCVSCAARGKEAVENAATRFPYPTSTRPRVFTSSAGTRFRVRDGVLEIAYPGEEWYKAVTLEVTYRGIVGLFDNPNETVNADA